MERSHTGRLIDSEPEMQNIPVPVPEGRSVREAFVPKDGFILCQADYSQIEIRIAENLRRAKGD